MFEFVPIIAFGIAGAFYLFLNKKKTVNRFSVPRRRNVLIARDINIKIIRYRTPIKRKNSVNKNCILSGVIVITINAILFDIKETSIRFSNHTEKVLC